MLRPLATLSESDLERELLRKGVDARSTGAERCSDCGRHPLVGERVHAFGDDEVCELCRPRRAAPASGSRVVHHVEHGVSVRRRALPHAA